MIITAKTLRDQRRALIGWAIGMAALVLLYASFYPSVRSNAATLNKYMESLPEALRNMIGNSGDISSPVGYIRSEVFSTMGPLLLLILAIGAGARAIAGEEEGRTLDLLLANPVRRRAVVLQKFWAMVVSTSGVGLVLLASIALFGPPFGLHVALVDLTATVVSAIALAVGFGSIALAVGCWRGRRGVAIAVSTSLAVVTYLLNILAPSVDGLSRFQILSPFYHYIEHDPLRTGFSALHLSILVAIAAVGLAIALVAFERRDLAS
jgi:ABC-2 type transport system permease protein